MADILIRGMEMPVSCSDCPIKGDAYCRLTREKVKYHHEYRHDLCPLHELPEHGDLIDRDKLEYHRAYFWHPDPELPDGGRFGGANAVVPSLGIKEAPVIVPASEEVADGMART